MRTINVNDIEEQTDEKLAKIAKDHATCGIDTYGVGSAILVDYGHFVPQEEHNKEAQFKHVYAGFNINLSGMEIKIHAEQLALFQVLLDIEINRLKEYATVDKVVVATTNDDLALKCGHCFQVLHGVCKFLNQDPEDIEYIAVKGEELQGQRGKHEGTHWTFDRYTLEELVGSTYIDKR